ncbi:MAG: T9SS type A sorting domain-containing protein [Saprospiraceae bacterium]|nr:T9SS type A sorting domain-containing protein [Saprospiraceae bacterium]
MSGNFVWAHKMVNTSSVWNTTLSFELDNANNICLTGYFEDTKDFNPGALGIFNMTAVGDNDGFVLKLNTSGNFMWAKQFGGTGLVFSKDLAIDDDNNIYSIGSFTGTADFNPSLLGVHNITSAGNTDVYISKLNSSGNFVWAKAISGVDIQTGESIEVDALNNVITIGQFREVTDFDPNPASTFNLTATSDIFISKLDVNGNFVWAKQLDNTTNNFTIDGLNHIYITGHFVGSYDCDPGPATYLLSSSGGRDFFTLRLNHDGIFQSAFKTGGTGSDGATCISMDASNNIYTAGYFQNTVDFNPGPGTFNLVALAGDHYSFITKLNQSTIPLPISLISFSANCQGNNVELYWSTATETNNDHFTVEQSGDGINFKAIGKIDSKGNGNSTNDYTYTYENPGLKDNYYRLKQTDFDGNFSYSKVIKVHCKDDDNVFSVYPNPSIDGLINIILSNDAVVTVMNALGKTIYTQSYPLGQHVINLSPNSGIYFIKVLSGSRYQSQKIVIE